MTVDQVYSIMKYAISKNTESGYLSPDDFNSNINLAQNQYLDYLRGEYQRYQVKRPTSPVSFGQNEMIRQSLSPLIYGAVLSINSGTGIAPYPSDFEFIDAMWSMYGLYNIRFTQQDRWSAWHRSSIDPISTNPVYLITHDGFLFDPTDLGSARLSYIRTPPTIKWGYTQYGDQQPVYDPLTSIDPVWSDTDIMQVIVRALAIVGVNLQLGVVSQYSEQIKQGGQ